MHSDKPSIGTTNLCWVSYLHVLYSVTILFEQVRFTYRNTKKDRYSSLRFWWNDKFQKSEGEYDWIILLVLKFRNLPTIFEGIQPNVSNFEIFWRNYALACHRIRLNVQTHAYLARYGCGVWALALNLGFLEGSRISPRPALIRLVAWMQMKRDD